MRNRHSWKKGKLERNPYNARETYRTDCCQFCPAERIFVSINQGATWMFDCYIVSGLRVDRAPSCVPTKDSYE